MVKNTPLEKVRAGQPTFGLAMGTNNLLIAEILARSGVDWVWIDEQHGSWDRAAMYQAIQVVSLAGCAPIVRAGSNEFFRIGRVLDAGALGLIVPMVNSAEEAEAAVHAAKYPPRGGRSSGGVRLRFMGDDYRHTANDGILVALMIETVEAVEAVREIASVDGVDCLFIGPGDLSVAMGVEPGSDEHEEAIQRIIRESNAVGTPVGFPCGNPEDAKMRADQGFTLIHAGSESGMIAAGIEHMKKTVGLSQ
ncbi:MAG: HpcH/HpaI aldolase family protein [Armatimonadota bacterium]|jgi:4-hydroxy-2-oxoheptanedioate aldolase